MRIDIVEYKNDQDEIEKIKMVVDGIDHTIISLNDSGAFIVDSAPIICGFHDAELLFRTMNILFTRIRKQLTLKTIEMAKDEYEKSNNRKIIDQKI